MPEKKFSCLRRPLLIDRLDDRERLLERVGFERDGDDDDFDGLELDLESVLGFDREEDRFDDGVFDDERFSIDLLLRVGVELCVAGAFAVVRLDVERVLIFGVGRDVKDDSDGLILLLGLRSRELTPCLFASLRRCACTGPTGCK